MFALNTHPDYRKPLGPADVALAGHASAAEAERFFSLHTAYAPTPLRTLPALARAAGVGAIHVKDESERLGLFSFKALGGMYAVARLVLEQAGEALGRTLAIDELDKPEVRAIAATIVVVCATDGNHGRSVAAGARLVGAKSRIFVHAGVSDERRAAMARLGATIIAVAGSYDDSVVAADQACAEQGWHCVSDTSWPGYERIPGHVMQGYSLLMKEVLGQLGQAPTHVFIQAGVGGFAASVALYLANALASERPCFVVVEPSRAACLLESMRAGEAIRIAHGQPTVMTMLECYTPSLTAWRVLSRLADVFMTVDEEEAVAIMRRLARPLAGDPPIVAGESGGVGLAGLLQATGNAGLRCALGLTDQSRILVVNTEGATDPAQFEALVGAASGAIRGSASCA